MAAAAPAAARRRAGRRTAAALAASATLALLATTTTLLLATIPLPALAQPSDSAPEPAEWADYRDGLKNLRTAEGEPVADALGSMLDWKFSIPLEAARRGMAFIGPNQRLRRVAAQMLAGRATNVMVLGGSISTGAVASRKDDANDPNDVWHMIERYFEKRVSPRVNFTNEARSATKSSVTSMCLDKFLPASKPADLIFVEFLANDGSEMDSKITQAEKARSYERFLRKLLRRSGAPAVVLLQMLVNEMSYPPEGMFGKSKRPFYSTPEDVYGNLAQYYGTPSLSFRNAMWQYGDNGRGGKSWGDIMGPDRLHPSDLGHKAMADLVVYLLQQTAVDLALHPASREDVVASMPPPMYGGNEAGAASMAVCAQGKQLEPLLSVTDGWTGPVDEPSGFKYPTYGWETSSAGKPLVLDVDTDAGGGRAATVTIGYTAAKSGYADAIISCGGGCTCEEARVSGSLTYDQVVSFLKTVTPTPSKSCQVKVTQAPGSSGKVRVTGVVVTADPGDVSGRVGETKYLAWLSGDKWASR
jgi:lysophospholipase L1-like esterase